MPLSSIVKIWTFIAPFLRNFVKIAFSLEWISTLFQSDWNESEAQKNSTEDPKSFDSIPGPRPSLPVIGTQWLYMLVGPYQLQKLHFANEDKYAKYGAIVKEHFLWNYPIIHLYDKGDIEEVLKYPSKYPLRPALEAQCIYRKSHPERYKSVGLVNAQGAEWHELRSKLTPELAGPKIIEHTLKQTSIVADELIDKIRHTRDEDKIIPQFEKLVYRFTLEAIVAIVLDQQLGSLRDDVSPMVERLLMATDKLFEVCHDTMYGFPFWKYFPSKAYNQLVECEDVIYDVFAGYVHDAMKETTDYDGERGGDTSILKSIVAAEGIDIRDKIATLIDVVSGGIDSTGNAIIFLLFNILSNERTRAEVYSELDREFPSGTQLTTEVLQQMHYLKACVTESFRLSPVAPNVARILEKDFVLQNYHVPAGTLVVCETWIAGLQEEHYENARQFVPERWLDGAKNKNPFLTVPFGVGRRRCPGKRVAEQEMMVVTAKLLQNFDIEFLEPVETIYKFLISPKGPINVTVKDRF